MLRPEPFLVTETPQFTKDVNEILGSWERWDEVFGAISLDLARDPDSFDDIGFFEGEAWHGVTLLTDPLTTLYFSVDDALEWVVLRRLIAL